MLDWMSRCVTVFVLLSKNCQVTVFCHLYNLYLGRKKSLDLNPIAIIQIVLELKQTLSGFEAYIYSGKHKHKFLAKQSIFFIYSFFY